MHEALANMKLSARASIRKAANIIQVTIIVKNLYQHGVNDFTSFTRRWNLMSTRTHQIIGKRAQSMKLLFGSTPEAHKQSTHLEHDMQHMFRISCSS